MICPELRATELSPEELLSIFRGLSIDDRLPRIIQQKTTQIKEAANQLTELQSEKEWVRRKADAQQQTETQTVTETAAEREADRDKERQKNTERERKRQNQRDGDSCTYTERERDKHTNRDKKTHRQGKQRRTQRQEDKQIGRQSSEYEHLETVKRCN